MDRLHYILGLLKAGKEYHILCVTVSESSLFTFTLYLDQLPASTESFMERKEVELTLSSYNTNIGC